MGRKAKKAKERPLRPWLSANNDCRDGRFIQVGNSMLLSKTFQALTGASRAFYLALAMESAGWAYVKMSHSSAKKYGIPKSSYDRAVRELVDAGFVEQVLDENLSQFSTNEFHFINQWKDKTPSLENALKSKKNKENDE